LGSGSPDETFLSALSDSNSNHNPLKETAETAENQATPLNRSASVSESQKGEEESLSSTLAKYINSRRYADIKLVVEGNEIHAHKAILCARSSHFQAMFTLGMREATSEVIEIADVSYNVFLDILRYLYTGEYGSPCSTQLPY